MRMKTVVTAIIGTAMIIAGLYAAWYLMRMRPPGDCQLSGRPIHPHMLTVVRVKGKTLYACCARCALTYQAQTGRRVRVLKVTDYLSGRLIAAQEAYFVDGSRVEPCCQPAVSRKGGRTPYVRLFDRCWPSLIAFSNPNDAATFTAEHGGTVTRLNNLEQQLKPGAGANGAARHD